MYGPPSGLNPPLLALLVDLRYSISIFVCRLVVTENISGGGGSIVTFALPGYAPGPVTLIAADFALIIVVLLLLQKNASAVLVCYAYEDEGLLFSLILYTLFSIIR